MNPVEDEGGFERDIDREVWRFARLCRHQRNARVGRRRGHGNDISISSIGRLLAAPLVHLCLPLTLHASVRSSLSARSRHSAQHPPQSAGRAHRRVDRIPRHNEIQPPRPVTEHSNGEQIDPRPIQDIPHKLGQAFRVEVLSGPA